MPLRVSAKWRDDNIKICTMNKTLFILRQSDYSLTREHARGENIVRSVGDEGADGSFVEIFQIETNDLLENKVISTD